MGAVREASLASKTESCVLFRQNFEPFAADGLRLKVD